MKKWLLIVVLFLCIGGKGFAQATELAQLALNIEKLNQFRKILSDMKSGYDILVKGYGTVKNIAEGNFKLHQVFLDGLMEVSPAVKKYKRVGDIINYELKIINGYKAALQKFRSSGQFSVQELDYISGVYAKLTKESLANLDDLAVVISSGKLRMSDEERLKAIDAIYEDISDKYHFLSVFNKQTEILRIQREKESGDVKVLQNLYK
ncbi:MAG TPA: TerB family tellurite resistance protein [Niabella sp.]|nr:TerB family tellurite resistance protein [Niabella sp.]HQX21404.1 TerB family tellurite resistance protein [Niabella sp.]HQX73329.1 TerB family tellurite resistance protein [Chitinophagaceae bacterium]HRB36152.1 TerB family tellurite resistance protein [Niabella sp.]HRB79464.1 TerB family tellurite resistance protein [Niabella sp.]